MNAKSELEELFRLEDMLRQVYSGRANLGTIDELISWLQTRRNVMVFVETGLLPGENKKETA